MPNSVDIFAFEQSCLCTKTCISAEEFIRSMDNTSVVDKLYGVVNAIFSQQYDECLQKCMEVTNIFEFMSSESSAMSHCKLVSKEVDIDNTTRCVLLFSAAVSCVQLFVQANWTGPSTKDIEDSNTMDLESKAKLFLTEECLSTVVHLVKVPHYLFTAKQIFAYLLENDDFQTVAWWLFRCRCLHSHLITERSELLYEKTMNAMNQALSRSFLLDKSCRSFLFQIHLEAGLSLLHYYQYKQADEHFQAAKTVSGVEFAFTGALGVRTKFQEKPVSQLQVQVTRKNVPAIESTVSIESTKQLPKNILLNDDTLLNKVKILDEIIQEDLAFSPEEYCMILAACTAMQKTSPAHRLKEEKVLAVIEFLLESPSCWCIHAEALRLRCLNERSRSRTVERSMTQLDNLISLVTGRDCSTCRLDLFYAVQPPPVWKLQKDLCKLYMSLGLTSSALEIYRRLEMWEDVALCLLRTDRSEQATKLIQEQLEVKETPNLLCLLGDILQKPEHYERAWQISKHRSTRAMTSLGYYHISRKEFQDAVDCFQKSLAVLSLQVNTWFTMGCAYLRLEEYAKAADAFRRCVNLDWDNYEAWTNLSTSYVRCGKKEQAFKALSEAIKCNFDKWQLWENYVAISTDVGQFSEAINAYDRLLDLKNKYMDLPILSVLVRVVTENIPDAHGNQGSSLKNKLLKLFGHTTSKVTSDSSVWRLYAHLYGAGVSSNVSDNEKAIEYLHKALRVGLQKSGWEKENDSVEKLVKICQEISRACNHDRENISNQTLSSLRLSVNGFSTKLKQRETTILNPSVQEEIRNHINEVSKYLQSIVKPTTES